MEQAEEEQKPTIEEIKQIVDAKRKTKKQIEFKQPNEKVIIPEPKQIVRKQRTPRAKKEPVLEPIQEPIIEPVKEFIQEPIKEPIPELMKTYSNDTKIRELQDDVYGLTNLVLEMMKTKSKIAKPKSKPKPKKVIKTLDLTITDKEIDAIVNDKPIEKKVNIKGSSTDDKLKAFLDAMIKK
jgi:hypothetical protein